jgi:16S rRNA (cytosine1402-N4)-methyltransferase
MIKNNEHIPVLLDEIMTFLDSKQIRVFFEGTLGLGGHAESILNAHEEIQTYLAFDQDQKALEKAKIRLQRWEKKVQFVHANFSEIEKICHQLNIDGIDAALLDIGVSSMQLDVADRGFSFRKDGPLDMRMDQTSLTSAKELINHASEKELGRILKDYGEVRFWKPLAELIVQQRKKKPIETTLELVQLVEKLFPKQVSKTHPATTVFQAIRIAVNNELQVLQECLQKTLQLLKKDGVFLVISFHSLEDRIVKQMFKEATMPIKNDRGKVVEEAKFEIITKKPIEASDKEMKANPRSRSAKLRIIRRIIE